jgi:hypothetical protein
MSSPRSARGYRLAVAGLLAALLTLALAGCVGIPNGGGVNVGPVVTSGNDQPSGADVPGGPTRGATRDEILADFMQAVVSPENDYGIARLYLTQAAAHAWNPTKSVLVRDNTAVTRDDPSGSATYTVTTHASIDDEGIYSEQSSPSSQSLSFSFEKVKGQWRISSLADGIVISRTSFSQSFTEQPLYFFDPTFQFLVPDSRWFPSGSSEQSRAVSALLGGPSPLLQGGVVVSAFPQGTRLEKAVALRNSTASVDLSAGASTPTPLVQARMLKQLQESLASSSVTGVSISVGGAPLQIAHAASGIVNVAVDPSPLVRRGSKFGFANRLTSLGRLTTQVTQVDASAVTLARNGSTAAALGKGGVYLLGAHAAPLLLDSRKGLIGPSIDPFGYVWSVPSNQPSAIRVTGSDGNPHTIASQVPQDSTIVALQVSHDGARVMMYLKTAAGPRLLVAGVIRRGNVPTSLGAPQDLPVSAATPVDATWADNDSVAALTVASDGVTNTIVTYTIGGTASDPSTTADDVHGVGGNGGLLRLVTSEGHVLELRSSGWQDTNVTASVLATQQ